MTTHPSLETFPSFSDMAALCFGSTSLSFCGLTVGLSYQFWNVGSSPWGSSLHPELFPLSRPSLSSENDSQVAISVVLAPACSISHAHLLLPVDLYCRVLTAIISPTNKEGGDHFTPSLPCYPKPTLVPILPKDMVCYPLTGVINWGVKFQFSILLHSTSNVSKFC